MKHLQLFESWGVTGLTLYHGAGAPHDFTGSGFVTRGGSFFAKEREMAEDFGAHVYAVTLRPQTRIFNACDAASAQLLIDRFGTLYNTYYEEDEEEYEVTDGETLAYASDNWDIIENNDGVLDWIRGEGHDGVRMNEGGRTTYLLFRPTDCILTNEKLP